MLEHSHETHGPAALITGPATYPITMTRDVNAWRETIRSEQRMGTMVVKKQGIPPFYTSPPATPNETMRLHGIVPARQQTTPGPWVPAVVQSSPNAVPSPIAKLVAGWEPPRGWDHNTHHHLTRASGQRVSLEPIKSSGGDPNNVMALLNGLSGMSAAAAAAGRIIELEAESSQQKRRINELEASRRDLNVTPPARAPPASGIARPMLKGGTPPAARRQLAFPAPAAARPKAAAPGPTPGFAAGVALAPAAFSPAQAAPKTPLRSIETHTRREARSTGQPRRQPASARQPSPPWRRTDAHLALFTAGLKMSPAFVRARSLPMLQARATTSAPALRY